MMSQKNTPGNTMLWDEILKAIVDAMPEQLFPLIKEVYGKDYPKGTPITLLATESSTYREAPNAPPGSRLSDIALLVNGAEYYHLECQMHNDQDMVIRMVAYDLHFAMQYTVAEDHEQGGLVMQFPRSAVIYPEKNSHIPDFLRCRIIFQDASEHIYQIPAVKIQSYSLQEIHEKHLTLFIPYVLLRLRPKLDPERKNPLEKKKLTAFVDKVMILLKDEVEQGYLTQQEYDDYINLFRRAAEKILEKHAEFLMEVDRMTKPLIELPSVLQKRLYAEIDSLNADKEALATDIEALTADKETLAADNKALTIELADKNAELARMRELLEQYHIPVTA